MNPLASNVSDESAGSVDDRRNTSEGDRRRNSDRRASPRKRILKGGLTSWQNGDSVECIVHNLSDTGAHLQVRGPVPKTFNLVIHGDHVSRACCVVWRNANRVGVKFEAHLEIAGLAASFKRHASQCRTLAERAAVLDRETLLKMAEAWEALVRRSRRPTLSAERASY